MSNLAARILTAAVGIPLVLVVLYLGGWPFVTVVVIVALAAQWEFYDLAGKAGLKPLRVLGLMMGLAVALRHFLHLWLGPIVLILSAVLVLCVLRRGDTRPIGTTSATALGVIYPTLLITSLVDLRFASGVEWSDPEAFYLTTSLLVLVWTTDTAAYFVGRAIGRRPLAPTVSPKKTWEGAVGGALGALVVAAILRMTLLDFLAWPHVVVIALVCGILSQLGDLAESKMKRAVGAKDSGRLLPGHGGLLDRIDALILAVPVVYAYLALAGSWAGGGMP